MCKLHVHMHVHVQCSYQSVAGETQLLERNNDLVVDVVQNFNTILEPTNNNKQRRLMTGDCPVEGGEGQY